jgi:hypothetical protein
VKTQLAARRPAVRPSAAQAYLSHGNAAVAADWDEF